MQFYVFVGAKLRFLGAVLTRIRYFNSFAQALNLLKKEQEQLDMRNRYPIGLPQHALFNSTYILERSVFHCSVCLHFAGVQALQAGLKPINIIINPLISFSTWFPCVICKDAGLLHWTFWWQGRFSLIFIDITERLGGWSGSGWWFGFQIPGHPFTMPSFGRMGAFKMSLGL